MIKKIVLLILLFSFLVSAQINHKIIFEKEHADMPFDLKIENSGIYSVSSFDILNDTVYFSVFNDKNIYKFYNSSKTAISEKSLNSFDFTADNSTEIIPSEIDPVYYPNHLIKKSYFGKETVYFDKGGELFSSNKKPIKVIKQSRSKAELIFDQTELKRNFELSFSDDLAMIDLIGIGEEGNIFLLVEKYIDKSLYVEREVLVLNKSGEILSTLSIPNAKFLYTIKDLQIDRNGNLYHLYSDESGVKIFKWLNLTEKQTEKIYYPQQYQVNIHFNNLVPTIEPVSTQTPVQTEVSSVRAEALRLAESYVTHEYRCYSTNLAPTNTTGPDGDIVRTPDWLIVGYNARIPYQWGGFSTLERFDIELGQGYYAGDIHTAGVSSYAVGVDCSGFVSRCWQMSYHSSTSMMPNITTQYSTWQELKPGDAVHKIGHVRLFVERNPNGSLKIIESTSRGWGVSFWTYSVSDLSAYTPRYYNNMTSNFNEKQPELLSTLILPNGDVELKWECDTSDVAGYRIYGSEDGETWNLLLDETVCTISEYVITPNSGANFYRVSSVAPSISVSSESYWSNVLGVRNENSTQKALVIDGFERESGSWRGAGNPFINKYGNALHQKSINFESIKNIALYDTAVALADYNFVFWMLGDESSSDETFSSYEQTLVKEYLENGGRLFVSGSEIGWDLVYGGSSEDKEFYNDYLKATYISDNSGSNKVLGNTDGPLANANFNFGQVYEEDYPDIIEPYGGSNQCMKYQTGTGAGIYYEGKFGTSTNDAKLIHLGFPPETTANVIFFNYMISLAVDFFNSPVTSVDVDPAIANNFRLEQNYPNPFNPTTNINFVIPSGVSGGMPSAEGMSSLKVYDTLGKEITTLLNKSLLPGTYEIEFDASDLPSGVYFYKLNVSGQNANFSETKKMLLLK